MIPTNPPPTFRKPELWSDAFTDFVKQCLVKSPEQRATATQLLQVCLILGERELQSRLAVVQAVLCPLGCCHFLGYPSHYKFHSLIADLKPCTQLQPFSSSLRSDLISSSCLCGCVFFLFLLSFRFSPAMPSTCLLNHQKATR